MNRNNKIRIELEVDEETYTKLLDAARASGRADVRTLLIDAALAYPEAILCFERSRSTKLSAVEVLELETAAEGLRSALRDAARSLRYFYEDRGFDLLDVFIHAVPYSELRAAVRNVRRVDKALQRAHGISIVELSKYGPDDVRQLAQEIMRLSDLAERLTDAYGAPFTEEELAALYREVVTYAQMEAPTRQSRHARAQAARP